MKIQKTKFKDLILIKSDQHCDHRGYFRELFDNRVFKKNFVFDCMSFSKKNVLRGLHFQKKKSQGKLISVLKGEIFDVAVDLRKNSKTYKKYFAIKVSEKSNFSIFIPENFAHGFLCLSKDCIIQYKCTNYRNKETETTLAWNDPNIGIKWPKNKTILSPKDKNGKSFEELFE